MDFLTSVLPLLCLLVLLAAVIWTVVHARKKNLHKWIGAYAWPAERVRPWEPEQPIEVFIAICDHYEPECYGATREVARTRVNRWVTEYPRLFAEFTDVDGRPPQHSFFFPQDEYRPEYLDRLKDLCEAGFGEVEIHLHHDRDTAAALREKLATFRDTLFHQHGCLRRDPETGQIVYGFIHGNWALCNSRPDGRFCGVDQELTVLLETGCYADFTLPSAPSPAQISTINSIYYAQDRPGRRCSHATGIRARVGQAAPRDHLLMVQGPLTLDWGDRRFGLLPRTENSDLHAGRGPSLRRLKMWLDAGVCVAGRPDWRFVKLHTHGCKDGNIDTLLGPETQQFHRELAQLHRQHPTFRYHYVSAWEMAQLVHQAERSCLLPQIARQPVPASHRVVVPSR